VRRHKSRFFASGWANYATALPRPATAAAPQSAALLQKLSAELAARDEKLVTLLADKAALNTELVRQRAEVAAAKQANASRPDTHDYSEAETRDIFIDLLLKEAGWPLDQPRDREYEVAGMPNKQGKGYVDYVLWGDDGKPLGLVEAKRTKRDARVGQQQAKLYADSLEKRFIHRPTNTPPPNYRHGPNRKIALTILRCIAF
jgi:type I restriction enzyme R subunit